MRLRYLKCIFLGCKRSEKLAYCVRCGYVVPHKLRNRIHYYYRNFRKGD
jgi:hypothetical protein